MKILPLTPVLLIFSNPALTACGAELSAGATESSEDQLSAAVGRNVRVSSDSTMAAQNQPAAAALLGSPGHLLIAAHDYPPGATQPVDGEAAFWLSRDGGRSFPTRGVVPGLTVSHGGVFEGASDLSLACATNHHCYLASFVYDLALSRTAIAVSHSGDGGATWDPPVLLIDEASPAIFNQRCSIAVDNSHGPNRGSVYVSWIRVASGPGGLQVPIYFAASHDQGQTFTAAQAISDPAVNRLNNKPVTAVDGQGRVYVAYENFLLNDPLHDAHLIQRSTDGGATFAPATLVAIITDPFAPLPPASFRNNGFPQLAIEPFTHALLVAWVDLGFGSSDVMLTRSTDGGTSWSAPARVTDTPLGDVIQHALPALACGPLGVCGVSFYSSRNDPTGLLMDTYFAPIVLGRSGANVRVSSVPMNPDVQFGGGFIGDYTALVIDWDAAHPVWTDTRVSQPDPQQDIFTARITARP